MFNEIDFLWYLQICLRYRAGRYKVYVFTVTTTLFSGVVYYYVLYF